MHLGAFRFRNLKDFWKEPRIRSKGTRTKGYIFRRGMETEGTVGFLLRMRWVS